MPREKISLIKIYGHASKKLLINRKLSSEDLKTNLMSFLQNLNLPIASSCQGEGICRLCVVNEKVISCKISVKDLPVDEKGVRKVTIGYL